MTTTQTDTETRSPAELEKNEEVTRRMHDMLEACAAWKAEQTPERFKAWREATDRYIAAHREWFALAMPGVDYDSVYGR
jgi:hypothetical protein